MQIPWNKIKIKPKTLLSQSNKVESKYHFKKIHITFSNFFGFVGKANIVNLPCSAVEKPGAQMPKGAKLESHWTIKTGILPNLVIP